MPRDLLPIADNLGKYYFKLTQLVKIDRCFDTVSIVLRLTNPSFRKYTHLEAIDSNY